MTPFVTAGAGFLLAVLWFDLMHDVQVLHHRRGAAPEEVLASIARYYRRVTTDARPMNRLVSVVMLGTIVSVIVQLVRDDVPNWASWVSFVLVLAPVTLAAAHTFRAAVRLGQRRDPLDLQSELARSILRDHLLCLVAIVTLLIAQLGFARGDDDPRGSSSPVPVSSRPVVAISPEARAAAAGVGVDLVQLTDEALRSVSALLPELEPVVKVEVGYDRVIPDMGVGGVTEPDGEVFIFVTDGDLLDAEQLRIWLPATLAHEAHHSVRIRHGPGTGITLGEKMVSEGLATVFALEAFPETPPQPWAYALDGVRARDLWRVAQPLLNVPLTHAEYSHSEWFGGSGRLPRWAGYSLGVGLVNSYLSNHPGATTASLVRDPADAIIAGSGYNP